MNDQKNTMADAILMAMDSESEAEAFYEKAAQNTRDPRGKDMFSQLAVFERSHFERLKHLLASLGAGHRETYEGFSFAKTKPGIPAASLSAEELKTDLDAISFAIESEKRAREVYLKLAASASEPPLKTIFQRLADEEELHRNVLDQQFFSLANRSQWSWSAE